MAKGVPTDQRRKNVIGVLEEMDSAAITVRQARCAVVRNRNVQCLKCAEACTSGCIHLEDGLLRVDASKCVGCGTCATVCPTCALEAHNPSDGELFEACAGARSDGRVAVMCRPCREALTDVLDGRAVAEVVCLGRVEESLLVSLVADGARSVSLVSGDCARCAQQKGEECAQMVAESACSLLRAWDREVSVEVTRGVPGWVLREGVESAAAAEALEGAFSNGFGNPAIEVDGSAGGKSFVGTPSKASAEPGSTNALKGVPTESDRHDDSAGAGSERVQVLRVMRDGTLPHFVPDRRERLLDVLMRLGDPAADVISTRLWGSVAIDPAKCVGCRMCAVFCPTGAIAKFDEDGARGIEHYPGDCVKCGSCRDICPGQAITISETVKAAYLFDGAVHRYSMRERPVELRGNPHQILDTMKQMIPGNVYER